MSAKKTTPSATSPTSNKTTPTGKPEPIGSAALKDERGGQSPVDEAVATAKEAADEAQSGAAGLKDKAKAEASRLAGEARDMAEGRAEGLKEQATSRIDETADNIRSAGREFGDDSYQAQAADYLASNLSQAAEMIREQDFSSLADDVSSFARRNPAMFLGGAALVGFAAARLMKSSEENRSDYARNDYARNDYGRNDYARNEYGQDDFGRDYGRGGVTR